jgi:hypothetical protein
MFQCDSHWKPVPINQTAAAATAAASRVNDAASHVLDTTNVDIDALRTLASAQLRNSASLGLLARVVWR